MSDRSAQTRIRWRCACWLTALLAGACSPVSGAGGPLPEAAPDQPLPESVCVLLEQLDSERFQTRYAAQQALAQSVADRPELLEQLARSGGGEVSRRMVTLLERIFLQHDNSRGDYAEQALQRLAASPLAVSADARAVLVGNARLRESRARRELEKLGAELVYVMPTSGEVARAQVTAPETGVGFGEPAALHSVWLHEDWKGKPEDLWHLTRLAHCPDLRIYKYFGNQVSIDELLQLGAHLPGLNVTERGPCLGIRQSAHHTEPIIEDVMPGGAAEKAGLRPHDRIRQLNGQRVTSFSHLVQLLLAFDIGDEVALEIDRGGIALKIPVTLCSWRGVLGRDEQNVPAPKPFYGPFDPRPADGSPLSTGRREVE